MLWKSQMAYATISREINGFCFGDAIGNPGIEHLFRRLIAKVFGMYADFHKPFQQSHRFFDSLCFCFLGLGLGLGLGHLF